MLQISALIDGQNFTRRCSEICFRNWQSNHSSISFLACLLWRNFTALELASIRFGHSATSIITLHQYNPPTLTAGVVSWDNAFCYLATLTFLAADKSLAKTFICADLLTYTRTKNSKVQYLGILLLFLDMFVLGLLNSFSFPVLVTRTGIYTEQVLFIEQTLRNMGQT